MLVLTRRVGEEIVIDGEIRLVVLQVHRQRARLGIMAPPSVRIHRGETYVQNLETSDPRFAEQEASIS
jgi:carbon storage regulator